MSYGTQRVRHNGSTVTFHCNKRASHRGFIYVSTPRGGRRVYGTVDWNSDAQAYVFHANTKVLAPA